MLELWELPGEGTESINLSEFHQMNHLIVTLSEVTSVLRQKDIITISYHLLLMEPLLEHLFRLSPVKISSSRKQTSQYDDKATSVASFNILKVHN